MIKSIVVILLACFVVIGAFGAAESEAKPVTLEYMTWVKSSADQAESFSASNPDINIDVQFFREDFHTQARVLLASGEFPDVWDMSTGSYYTQFVDGGAALDITDIYRDKGWDDYYSAGATEAVTRNGKIHGLVVGGVFPWQTIYVNVDLFKRLGLEYPKTIDDMIKLVPKLRADGVEPFGFVNADGWMGQIIYGDYMMQLVEADTAEKLNSGELKWNGMPELVKGFEALKKLVDADAFMVGWQSGGIDDMRHAFLSQKVATMYVGTWWILGDWGGPYDFTIDSIPLPLIDANQPPKGYQTYPDVIAMASPKTEHRDEAIEFLSSFASDAFHRDILGKGGSLTTIPSVNPQLDLPDFVVNEQMLNQFNYPLTNYWTTSFPMPVEEVLATQFDLIMAGKTSIKKALDALEAEHKNHR